MQLARCSRRLPRPGGRLVGVTEFGWLLVGREFGLLARELEQLRSTLESSSPKLAAALDPETVAVGYIEPAEPASRTIDYSAINANRRELPTRSNPISDLLALSQTPQVVMNRNAC